MKNLFSINKFSIIMRIFMFAGTLSGTKAVLNPAHKNSKNNMIKVICQIKALPGAGSMTAQHNNWLAIAQKTTIPYNVQQDDKKILHENKDKQSAGNSPFADAENNTAESCINDPLLFYTATANNSTVPVYPTAYKLALPVCHA